MHLSKVTSMQLHKYTKYASFSMYMCSQANLHKSTFEVHQKVFHNFSEKWCWLCCRFLFLTGSTQTSMWSGNNYMHHQAQVQLNSFFNFSTKKTKQTVNISLNLSVTLTITHSTGSKSVLQCKICMWIIAFYLTIKNDVKFRVFKYAILDVLYYATYHQQQNNKNLTLYIAY